MFNHFYSVDTTGAREEVDNLDLTPECTEQVQDGLSESFTDQPLSLNIEECLLLFNDLLNEKRKALFSRGEKSWNRTR